MNVTLRMYQVLLFKFRRHLRKGSMANDFEDFSLRAKAGVPKTVVKQKLL